MIGENSKVRQLLEEIAMLEEENRKLTRELYEAKEQEIYKTAQSYSYHDAASLYHAIPLSMITTPFYFRREALTKKATACFCPKIIRRIKSNADFALDYSPQLHFAMFCERVIECAQGIMFVLSDPYRSIQTEPVGSMTVEEAENYVGKIVIAKLIIPENYQAKKCFALKAIKETDYASGYRMEHEDWRILRQYLSATGTKECMDALKCIEHEMSLKYPNSKENMKSYCSWVHENEFRITTDKRLMCFCVKDGTLWYADEVRTSGAFGSFSVAGECSIWSATADVFGNESIKDTLLLLAGEENFEFFTW